MIKRAVQLALVLTLVLSGTSVAFAFTTPAPTGHVNDRAQMFSSKFVEGLESQLTEYEKVKGVEIAVLTVPDLQGESIEGAAVEVFEQWGIGQKGQDNGLLLLISRDDRKIRFEVGYGLEAYITDGRAGRIIREEMTPAFQESRYEDGVAQALLSVETYLEGAPATPDEDASSFSWEDVAPALFFGFFIFFRVIVAILAVVPGIWLGGVMGGGFGLLLGIALGLPLMFLVLPLILFAAGGTFFDYIVSNYAARQKARGLPVWWWRSDGGGGGFGSGGGGFSGFGGGRSGGGGASGGW